MLVVAHAAVVRLRRVLGGTLVFGFVVHAIVGGLARDGHRRRAVQRGPVRGTWLAHVTGCCSRRRRDVGNYAFVALIAALLRCRRAATGGCRSVTALPILYLAAFVWENLLVTEPATTRLILLGALLVVLMIARPQGLLGTHEGRDRMMADARRCSSWRASSKAFGGLPVDQRPRPARRTRARSSA